MNQHVQVNIKCNEIKDDYLISTGITLGFCLIQVFSVFHKLADGEKSASPLTSKQLHFLKNTPNPFTGH